MATPCRRFFFLLIVIAGILDSRCFSDEPLWIVSTDSTDFFHGGYADVYRKWLDQFSPDDEMTTGILEWINRREQQIQDRYIGQFGVQAWARLTQITPKGSVMAISGLKVPAPDSLIVVRDDYVKRIGQYAEVEKHDGLVVVRGPERVTITKDGYRDVDSWLPLFLRYHEGWLFTSSNEEFAQWRPSSDLIKHLNRLDDKSWFRESRPTKVSENGRQALLANAFTTLGTKQQRLDGESDAAFQKRAAPHALWELFLKTQFFHTNSISGWRSQVEEGQKVRYFYEITAEEGSEFADVLKQLRHQSLMPSPDSTWCSAAVSFNVPTVIGSQLANLIPTDLPDPITQRLAVEIARSLQSGSLHMGSWLKENEAGNLLNGVTGLSPVQFSDPAIPETSETVGNDATGNVFTRRDITPEGILEWHVGQADPDNEPAGSHPSGLNSLPVLFSARLNVLELAQAGRTTEEFDLYEYCQDKYLRYRSPKYPKLSIPVFYSVRPEDRMALDELRDRIVGDDPERWTVSITVTVNPRKRQLAVRINVGDQLYGFLTVAEKYWQRAAGAAVKINSIGP